MNNKTMNDRYRRIFLVMGITSLGLFFTNQAATARRRSRFRGGIRSTGPKTYSTDVLSLSELESCLRLQKIIEQTEENLERLSMSIEQDKQSLSNLGKSLDRQRSLLNRQAQSDVNTYNQNVVLYEKKRQLFNFSVDQYNQEVQKLNSSIDSFNQLCGQKLYYEDDMALIRRKLGLPNSE